jgi:hypothetical protein
MKMRINAALVMLPLSILCVLSMAPGQCGIAAQGFFSGDPAPDVQGEWAIEYENDLNVEINVGGQVYTGTIGGTAGSFSFDHDGETYTFELDCSQPAVVCPSEVFPDTVTLEQRRFEDQPHQVHMPARETNCIGQTRLPVEEDGECGGETDIPCEEEICEGTVTERERVALGSISAPEAEIGDTPDYVMTVALGASFTAFTTPLGACIGLAGSHAEADIIYDGTYDTETNNMIATQLANGEIIVSLGGACLIAAADGGVAGAALAGATVQIWTGFTANPVN